MLTELNRNVINYCRCKYWDEIYYFSVINSLITPLIGESILVTLDNRGGHLYFFGVYVSLINHFKGVFSVNWLYPFRKPASHHPTITTIYTLCQTLSVLYILYFWMSCEANKTVERLDLLCFSWIKQWELPLTSITVINIASNNLLYSLFSKQSLQNGFLG